MKRAKNKFRLSCNKGCGRLFTFTHTKELLINNIVRVNYVECPKCNTKYLIGLYGYKINSMVRQKESAEKIKSEQGRLLYIYEPELVKAGIKI